MNAPEAPAFTAGYHRETWRTDLYGARHRRSFTEWFVCDTWAEVLDITETEGHPDIICAVANDGRLSDRLVLDASERAADAVLDRQHEADESMTGRFL